MRKLGRHSASVYIISLLPHLMSQTLWLFRITIGNLIYRESCTHRRHWPHLQTFLVGTTYWDAVVWHQLAGRTRDITNILQYIVCTIWSIKPTEHSVYGMTYKAYRTMCILYELCVPVIYKDLAPNIPILLRLSNNWTQPLVEGTATRASAQKPRRAEL